MAAVVDLVVWLPQVAADSPGRYLMGCGRGMGDGRQVCTLTGEKRYGSASCRPAQARGASRRLFTAAVLHLAAWSARLHV